MKSLWRRWRQNYWLALTSDALGLICVLWLIHSWQTRDLPVDPPQGKVELARLNGQGSMPVVQTGEVGVVYFFAPWCHYCKASINNLDGLVAGGKIAWGRAVALNYDNREEVRVFAVETGIELPVLMGTDRTAKDWSIRAFPTYFVIDANGKISSRSVGYSTWLGLRLRTLL